MRVFNYSSINEGTQTEGNKTARNVLIWYKDASIMHMSDVEGVICLNCKVAQLIIVILNTVGQLSNNDYKSRTKEG